MIVSAVGLYTEGSLTGAVGGHVLVTTLTALEPGQDLDLVPVLLPLVMVIYVSGVQQTLEAVITSAVSF